MDGKRGNKMIDNNSFDEGFVIIDGLEAPVNFVHMREKKHAPLAFSHYQSNHR